MSVAIMKERTTTNRTDNLPLVTYLTVVGGYKLVDLDGVPGHRVFVLDRVISPEVIRAFHCSTEKRLLDAHKNLKQAACT
jgi:hypothetical protein